MTDNPLTKLGDLSKPATVLIEKISDAIGGIFKPHQIVRVAKAEAEANRIHAESQIQVNEQDALDILTTVSLIHRRLDKAVRTHVP